MSSTDSKLEFVGVVEDSCKDVFKVRVNDNLLVSCTLSGKIRQNAIKITVGDKVKIEASVYDTSRGRIMFREKAA